MTKATTSAMQCVRDTVTQAMSRMFASCPELAGRVTAPWAGYSGVMEIAGLDQRGHPFATPLLDFSMASGGGAFPTRDGIHTCGSIGSPGMSMANAEVYEQRYPLLILARREEMDTAGAGRFEGGSALCVMATPHDTDRIPDIIFHTHGMHAPSTVGLHGGLPGSTFRCVVKRETDVQSVLARGRIPRHLADLAGEIEVLPGISRSYLNKGDVYLVLDNGGGGYGDPLDRSLHLIEDDLRLGYLSPSRAESIYGVAFSPDRRVDEHLTLEQRNDMRRRRLEFVTQTGDGPADTWLRTGQAGQPVTDRIQLVESQGGLSYGCKCGAVLGKADRDYRRYLPHFDAPCTSAGPHCLDLIPEPQVFLRNYVCPSCGSLAEVNLLSAEHGERID